MEKPTEEMIACFATVSPGGPEAEERKMFGHPAAFVHGNMFMGLHGSNFFVRLDDAGKAEAFATGATPFVAMGRTMREYVFLPDDAVHDADSLRAWVDRAYGLAAAMPAKAPKPPKPTKAKRG